MTCGNYISSELYQKIEEGFTMGIECLLDRGEYVDETHRETLTMMREAASFMANTLNDVLNMQKIEEGKLELEFQPFSISDTIDTIIKTFIAPSAAKKIKIVPFVTDAVPLTLIGDRFRIEHVIANYISNALKFSPENSTITVRADVISSFSIAKRTVDVCVSVTDEGIGISEEDQ